MKQYDYKIIKICLKDEKTRTKLKEIFAHFGTSHKAAERIILAYDTGALETKFA